MTGIYLVAAFWFLSALVSTILANRLKISNALMEIIIGAIIGFVAFKIGFTSKLALDDEWMKFIAGLAAIMLTFLAGAELNPDSLKSKFREITIVGLVGFFAPFIGASLIAYFILDWGLKASLLTGIALSTTSMAVVYAVMIEYGFNKTSFGKSILGACFVNDLGTVIGLGLIFAPFTFRTLIFIAVTLILIFILPTITNFLIKRFAFKTAAIRTKWLLFVLLSMGVLALWSGSEPVLPAYIIGMILAKTIEKDNFFVRRLRTMTIGFLTPIYFLRAGALVSLQAVIGAFMVFILLFGGKILFKIFGLYPVISRFKKHQKEKWYYTLLMSTGLTFGTISALYGLTNDIINTEQYSIIVGVVIASAVVPTLIANKFFLPDHLLEKPILDDQLPDTVKRKK
ncbi:MAG TPA: cation:proton antiporter [Bacteroidales bacterium]|jgi:Kef-type K+ transport system membrane component KefB|nr:cation:proton antiporter [Bacteroidales bacterium]OQB59698.1 MAG: glutathione-regulated potassium-efflux system protein KefB [Bacteroidetes bacterium ADurb.Bin145]HQG63419.1 cation:proton antiporter [Bacteroidales bacterium]HQK68329.1 cation:proton antiporter [Bacteroidales bacterium]